MRKAAKYTGTDVGAVRIGDKPVKPGDVLESPPHPLSVIDELLKRGDFIATGMVDELEAADSAINQSKRHRRGAKE